MNFHRALAGGCLFSLAVALPGDLSEIWTGLHHPDPTATWKLSLGLSLKTSMAVLAVVGLWRDRTWGYVCLLGSSAQNFLINFGELMALESVWFDHRGQLVRPALESVFRLFCLGYLALHWRLLLDIREDKS